MIASQTDRPKNGYFLLRSLDCMMKTCMLLAGGEVL